MEEGRDQQDRFPLLSGATSDGASRVFWNSVERLCQVSGKNRASCFTNCCGSERPACFEIWGGSRGGSWSATLLRSSSLSCCPDNSAPRASEFTHSGWSWPRSGRTIVSLGVDDFGVRELASQKSDDAVDVAGRILGTRCWLLVIYAAGCALFFIVAGVSKETLTATGLGGESLCSSLI